MFMFNVKPNLFQNCLMHKPESWPMVLTFMVTNSCLVELGGGGGGFFLDLVLVTLCSEILLIVALFVSCITLSLLAECLGTSFFTPMNL